MEDTTLREYLDRIGATAPAEPDLDGLRHLQERHMLTVPFENLDYHLRVPIEPGQPAVDKIVHRRRGGTCRELNGAFGSLLGALGYSVSVLAGRVLYPDRPGVAVLFGHVVLCVDLGQRWLVDVGFGRSSRQPLCMDHAEPQVDPHGHYRVIPGAHGDVDVHRDGVPIYRIETRERDLHDLTPVLRWLESSPDSPCPTLLFCSLPTPRGRVTLSGDTLTRVEDGQRTRTALKSDHEIRETYRTVFGIELETLPPIPDRQGSADDLVAAAGEQ